jgi:predicted dehydrogenase
MTSIPIALVGIDHPHVEEWHSTLLAVPELAPVAHYDPNPAEAVQLLAHPFDQLPVYGDLGELLAAHQIQAALVMLPLREAERALMALGQAGIHILAEKPVARTAGAMAAVMGTLAPDTVFYAGYCWRVDPMIQQFASLLDAGILGQIWSIEMSWITSRVGRREGEPAHRDPASYLFRSEVSRGGMLQWLGCHFVDLMVHLAQQPVTSVMALTARQTTDEIDVEDTASCLLRFGDGALGSLNVGYLLPSGNQMFIGLRGSLGWAHWDAMAGRRYTVHSEHPSWIAAPTRHFEVPRPPLTTYGAGMGELLLRDFVRCIDENGREPIYTASDACHVLQVLDAAYQSASSGQAVSIRH